MTGFCKSQAEIVKMSTLISPLALGDREIILLQEPPAPQSA